MAHEQVVLVICDVLLRDVQHLIAQQQLPRPVRPPHEPRVGLVPLAACRSGSQGKSQSAGTSTLRSQGSDCRTSGACSCLVMHARIVPAGRDCGTK